jgi:hypothetical protein
MSTPSGQGGPRRDLPGLRSELERLRRLAHQRGSAPGPETELSGILRRLEIEGGAIVLDADDGTTYELAVPPGWSVEPEPGARVRIRGRLATDVVTTTMVGPVIEVASIARPR